MLPVRSRWLAPLFLLVTLAGCGQKDLIDDSLSSPDQIRSLVAQFKEAAVKNDDDAACDLMDGQMRSDLDSIGVFVDGEEVRLQCGLIALMGEHAREGPSLPSARIVYIRISKHDDTGDVQLDNGTRLVLQRAGTNADGEWRIHGHGYLPDPRRWDRGLQPSPHATVIRGPAAPPG
jgi:hypothetical protein